MMKAPLDDSLASIFKDEDEKKIRALEEENAKLREELARKPEALAIGRPEVRAITNLALILDVEPEFEEVRAKVDELLDMRREVLDALGLKPEDAGDVEERVRHLMSLTDEIAEEAGGLAGYGSIVERVAALRHFEKEILEAAEEHGDLDVEDRGEVIEAFREFASREDDRVLLSESAVEFFVEAERARPPYGRIETGDSTLDILFERLHRDVKAFRDN
jgi:hypothetical protein